jgi:secreted protein with Ig-like and vWFA domain
MGVDTVTGLRLGMESQIASIAEVSAAVAEAATIEPTVGGFSTTNPTGLVVGGSVAGDGGNPNTTEINVTVPVTVGAGMTAEDGDRIGRTAGVAASQELRRILRLEGVVA